MMNNILNMEKQTNKALFYGQKQDNISCYPYLVKEALAKFIKPMIQNN